MKLLNSLKLLLRRRVSKEEYTDFPAITTSDTAEVLLPHPKPPRKKGKVITATKSKEWHINQKHRRGGTVKAMPRELRRIKRAQAREQAISE